MKFYLEQQKVEFKGEYSPEGEGRIVHFGTHDPSKGPPVPVLKLSKVGASTIAIWMDGQYTWQTKPNPVTFPLAIEWKLWSGVGCMVDQSPRVGVTILKNETDFSSREGKLFQVDCDVAMTWWLTARIVGSTDGVLQLPLRVIFWPLSGRPESVVGSAIG